MVDTVLAASLDVSMQAADQTFMEMALVQANLAREIGEVPVGAVAVDGLGNVIGYGHNRTIIDADPTAHAEIVALRAAAKKMGNYRLPGVALYVTLEPCVMCMGAMLHARLARIVFGATDPKTGACGSIMDIGSMPQINHHTAVCRGVLAEPCGDILRQFFRARRNKETRA